MKKLFILALCALPLAGFAQKELPRHKSPKQSKLDKDVWSLTYNDAMPLQYIQPKELIADVEADAKLKMWTPQVLAEKKEALPAGGYLQVNFFRRTLGYADPHQLTFIVQAPDGTELMRYQPEHDIPHYMASSGNYYSIALVPLKNTLESGSKVFVIDDGEKYRFEFEVKPL